VKQIPPVKAVMTPFPHCIGSDEPFSRARAMMDEHGIRHLPVIEEGKLAGVLTERDLRLAAAPALAPAGSDALRVRDVTPRDAYVVELHEPLDVVVLHMARQRIDCALVVKHGRLVGIFTMTDACRCLGGLLRSLFPRGRGDDAA
jgi:acetoin utilization protein AcuB